MGTEYLGWQRLSEKNPRVPNPSLDSKRAPFANFTPVSPRFPGNCDISSGRHCVNAPGSNKSPVQKSEPAVQVTPDTRRSDSQTGVKIVTVDALDANNQRELHCATRQIRIPGAPGSAAQHRKAYIWGDILLFPAHLSSFSPFVVVVHSPTWIVGRADVGNFHPPAHPR